MNILIKEVALWLRIWYLWDSYGSHLQFVCGIYKKESDDKYYNTRFIYDISDFYL